MERIFYNTHKCLRLFCYWGKFAIISCKNIILIAITVVTPLFMHSFRRQNKTTSLLLIIIQNITGYLLLVTERSKFYCHWGLFLWRYLWVSKYLLFHLKLSSLRNLHQWISYLEMTSLLSNILWKLTFPFLLIPLYFCRTWIKIYWIIDILHLSI